MKIHMLETVVLWALKFIFRKSTQKRHKKSHKPISINT